MHALQNLFRMNAGCSPAEKRVLLTALHAAADIYYCESCKTALSWKCLRYAISCRFIKKLYMCISTEAAFESSQKYKKANSEK